MRALGLLALPLLLAAAPADQEGGTGALQPAPVPGGVLPKIGRHGVGQANPGSEASISSGPTYSTPFSGAPSPTQTPSGAAGPSSTVAVPGSQPSASPGANP